MNAAAPSVGGDRMAPTPAAASIPPACSGGYPARRSIGQVTAPTLTAVAVPEPETVPSRNPAATAVRPAALRDLRKAATDRSTKNRLAPERSSTAP
ncbi:hypothetical protein Apa02nite_000140 [Actinoplanes palleronii]|uniref:Uncharacterized protein n=1 Tax=Actinoplanes palleronii TaxID=113570 RepID=A0ABQ4AZN6_9ACTN|nr:hypothetical protein Apa02nite_000140 [Actinoplanes palleronii]